MTRRGAPWLVAGVLAVALLAVLSLPRKPQEDPRVLRMRTELLAARAEAQGWRQTLVEATGDLEEQLLATRDSMGLLQEEKAALAQEVEALGGRIQVLADMYADVRGQLTAAATVHGPGESPDSVTARLDDGLLTGRVAYFPLPRTFDLEYVARLGLVLGVIEAPDGRALLTARSPDERVDLEYGATYYQRPEPIRVCSLSQRLTWGGYGAGVGLLGGLVLGILR